MESCVLNKYLRWIALGIQLGIYQKKETIGDVHGHPDIFWTSWDDVSAADKLGGCLVVIGAFETWVVLDFQHWIVKICKKYQGPRTLVVPMTNGKHIYNLGGT